MPLISSISGVRGVFGDGLDPDVLVRYSAAFGRWVRSTSEAERPLVLIGRDGRTTGALAARIVSGTLEAAGCRVIDAGMTPTPTLEVAIEKEEADGGLMLSASHNPAEWNALKLFNRRGEYLSAEAGGCVQRDSGKPVAEATRSYDAIGDHRRRSYLDHHVERILALPYVRPERIREAGFTVVVDGINSVGGPALTRLLDALGVEEGQITCLNCEPTGRFAHPPEPRPEHLEETVAAVAETGADLGLVVDPDVDRLALVEDGGRFFGEELTQVVAADFLWRHESGPFVTNLSSSRTIEDVAAEHGEEVYRSPVGEINVVEKMKEKNALIGGEGNGGVILPRLHYGRDALVGSALVLQYLAEEDCTLSDLGERYPRYVMSKDSLPVEGLDPDTLLAKMRERYADEEIDTQDGLKIDFPDRWVHMRESNTEPILRIYTEAPSEGEARELGERFKGELEELAGV